jgi:hypothetical protein
VGFEPTNGGFADLSLGPLGYRARARQYIEKRWSMSVARAEYEKMRPATLSSCYRRGSSDLRLAKETS